MLEFFQFMFRAINRGSMGHGPWLPQKQLFTPSVTPLSHHPSPLPSFFPENRTRHTWVSIRFVCEHQNDWPILTFSSSGLYKVYAELQRYRKEPLPRHSTDEVPQMVVVSGTVVSFTQWDGSMEPY